jgi:4-aminobutyrate aminotransferase
VRLGQKPATPEPAEGDANASPRRAAWQAANLGPEARALLAADEAVFLRQSLSTPCLNTLAGAAGSHLTDLDGRRYLDFHGNSLHQVGYGHPRVVAAVKAQLEALSFCPRRYANRPAAELGRRLAGLFPGEGGSGAKVLLTPGGTTAVGLALKLARQATGRFKTLSFWDSFHGASLDAISIGGEALFRSGSGPLLPGASLVPPPEPYRCRLNPGGDCAACGLRCAELVAYVMEHEGDVGAIIAEPVRATAVHLPPPGFWPRVREICDRHGALLIFDETAVCLGRTGEMLACEHFGARPDIITLGKGLGGGIFPLAAVLARPELDLAPDRALGHYTHEKSPVGAAAALATLDVLADEGLVERSRRLGAEALARLAAMAVSHPLVGQVRGLGLALAVELVTDRATRTPATDAAEAVMYACLTRGLSFKVSHGNILTLTPPLTIAEADLWSALDIVDTALAEVEASLGR